MHVQVLCALVSGDADKQRWVRLVGMLPLLHRLTIGHPRDIPGEPRSPLHSYGFMFVFSAARLSRECMRVRISRSFASMTSSAAHPAPECWLILTPMQA